jgi:hypothetical protein
VEENTDASRKPAEKPLFEPVIIEVRKPATPAKEPEKSDDTNAKNAPRRSRVVEVK